MTIIAGVDPGKSGAITFIDTDRCTIAVHDMPVRSLGANSKRTEVDAAELGLIFAEHCPDLCWIEDVWSTSNDGHVGAFSFGDAYGTVKGVCGGLAIPLKRVRPQVWKKTMRVTADKNLSRSRASQLFPDASSLFSRVKDDGRAESALIAFYGVCEAGIKIKHKISLDSVEAKKGISVGYVEDTKK